MSTLLKDNRLPIAISAAALLLATYIGLVPTFDNDDASQAASTANAENVAALEDRIAALEAMLNTAPAGVVIPDGADNARLRQEIDLIVRGLANQTGRVSRLKDAVEGLVDENGQAIPPARVMDEIALAKRGLANLTGRINGISDQVETLDTAAADIARLQQQMANAETAFARIAQKLNEARSERDGLAARLDSAPATDAAGTNQLQEIETKLDAILDELQG